MTVKRREKAFEEKLAQNVRELERRLQPDVARIEYSIGRDWVDEPAVYFRITLSEEATRGKPMGELTTRLSSRVWNELDFADSDYTPYSLFKTDADQASPADPR